jgi:hypothetical protein
MSDSEAKNDKDHLILMLGSNSEEPKINPQSALGDSCDEPLFVLKYRREKVMKILIPALLPLALFGLGVFDVVDVPNRLLLRVTGVIGLFIVVPFFLEGLLFREVRLYKDRMVKIWNCIGKREVNLADAGLLATADDAIGVGRFKLGPYSKIKRFFDRRTNVAWSYMPCMGVFYNELAADQDDVKKLNTLLADLTGRKVEEFEPRRFRMDRLIQEERR